MKWFKGQLKSSIFGLSLFLWWELSDIPTEGFFQGLSSWVTEVQNFLYISSWGFYSQSTINLFKTGKYLKGRSSARFWDHLSVIPFYSSLCCLERYVMKIFQLIKYLLLKYFSQFLKHYFLFVLWENISSTTRHPYLSWMSPMLLPIFY